MGLDPPDAGPCSQRIEDIAQQTENIDRPDGGIGDVAVADQTLFALADVEAVAMHTSIGYQGVTMQALVCQAGVDDPGGRTIVPMQAVAPSVPLGFEQGREVAGL